MEITLKDLWNDFEKESENMAIELRKIDPVMVGKIESVIHHYNYQNDKLKVISIFNTMDNIHNMLNDVDNYCININAGDQLKAKIQKFKTSVDMFFTILYKEYITLTQEKTQESKPVAVNPQEDFQSERNNHIYDIIPENKLNESIVKDKEERLAKAEEMANRAKAFSAEINDADKKIDEKIKSQTSTKKKAAKSNENK